MGLISQFTLNMVKGVTPEINSGQALNLFQGLNNIEIPKRVRNDSMTVF